MEIEDTDTAKKDALRKGDEKIIREYENEKRIVDFIRE